MSFIARQIENERSLAEYMDFLQMLLCRRCWRSLHKMGKPYHHRGGFIHLASQIKINEEGFKSWLHDEEHGLLHGLHVGFFAYTTRSTKEKDAIKDNVLVDYSPATVAKTNKEPINCRNFELQHEAACIGHFFHDYCRCQGKVEQHDLELRRVIPFLDDATYCHSNPEDAAHPLVVADRIELMRFADHQEWCDPEMCRIGTELYGPELLRHYYQHLRPCIAKILADLDSVWFSHVIESKTNSVHDSYPVGSWVPIDKGLQYNATNKTPYTFSVNHGRLPVEQNCHAHTATAMFNIGSPSIMGLISNSNVRQFADVEPAPPSCWGRDHLFLKLKSPIPWKDWLFVYDDINDLKFIKKEQCCCMNRTLFNRCVIVLRQLIDLLHITTVSN